jgi:hypothetical protein
MERAHKERLIAGYIGRSGSGKTYLIKTHAAAFTRTIIWDWRGEYDGPTLDRADLPTLLKQKSFCIRVRPNRLETLPNGFAALAHLVTALFADVTIICDEVALVTPNRTEGGIGQILRYARPQRIGLLWATQRPTGIPGILLAETRMLYCFHCDARADLIALSHYLPESKVGRIGLLPVREFITVSK